MKKDLPKIMYDQSQFTSLWMIDKNGLWLNEKAYLGMREIAGYAPSAWYLYTQNVPESFWFGAYDEEALEKEAQVGFANFTNSEFVKKFEAAIRKSYDLTRAISHIYFKEYYQKESDWIETNPERVRAFLEQIHEMATHTMSHYYLTQPQEFQKFGDELKSYLPNPDLELVSTNGRSLTHISEIQKFIFDLASAVQASGLALSGFLSAHPESKDKIDLMIEDIGFLNWGLLGGEKIDMAYVEKMVNDLLSDQAKFDAEKNKFSILMQNGEKRKKLISQNHGIEFALADIMGHSSVMRFNLQTYMLCAMNYANNFIKALQKKYDLSNDEIASYYYSDILNLVSKGTLVEKETIDERQKGYLHIYQDSGSEVFLGASAHTKIKDLLEFRLKEITNTVEVKGSVASNPQGKDAGVIEGRAFVLTTAFDIEAELAKFKKGDILVATQTHPHLVPYMMDSIAIVTDEGGITCHAAIVSRELRKPCIIGVKLGTKIFKTGDKLEVDLRSGRVRKIDK